MLSFLQSWRFERTKLHSSKITFTDVQKRQQKVSRIREIVNYFFSLILKNQLFSFCSTSKTYFLRVFALCANSAKQNPKNGRKKEGQKDEWVPFTKSNEG